MAQVPGSKDRDRTYSDTENVPIAVSQLVQRLVMILILVFSYIFIYSHKFSVVLHLFQMYFDGVVFKAFQEHFGYWSPSTFV